MQLETNDSATPGLPFDSDRLDLYMEQAGIDVLLVTSKHNIRYLLGGYYNHQFENVDAIGASRYLPVLIYPKGHSDRSAYIGTRSEKGAIAARPSSGFWVPNILTSSPCTIEAMRLAASYLQTLGTSYKRIGIEGGFLPVDAADALRGLCPDRTLVEALRPLERLRSCKTDRELRMLRQASELVVESMYAVMTKHGAGTRKRDLVEALRREETSRGLVFEYALVTVGSSHDRAPSDEIWQPNDVLSLDSGGHLHGYIGDLCRMAVLGEPDSELQDLLAEVDSVQQAARNVVRPGLRGGDIFAAADRSLAALPSSQQLQFVAHGMGLVSHEAPRLTASGPIPYAAADADLPLEPGMVLSIETTLLHPRRGFIKLEDTVAVTESGSVGLGDRARGWTSGGTDL